MTTNLTHHHDQPTPPGDVASALLISTCVHQEVLEKTIRYPNHQSGPKSLKFDPEVDT